MTATPLIFDGMCVLCSSGVQFMLARDPEGSTRFAAIQEAVPRALYAHYGLDADAFDTFMVLRDGQPYVKWQGLLAAGRTLPQALARAGRRRTIDTRRDRGPDLRLGAAQSLELVRLARHLLCADASLRLRMLEPQALPATAASETYTRRFSAPGIEADAREHQGGSDGVGKRERFTQDPYRERDRDDR